MWPRHRPDVSLRDLAFGARTLLLGAVESPPDADDAIVRDWFPSEEAVVCLSVRSGFDLLVQSLPLRAGDDILFTEVTIAGMTRIVEAAGAEARGVPVDRSTLAANPAAVAARISPRTRAIVVAPLFGSRNPIGPLADVARRRGVLVIEDAAQAFAGKSFPGSPDADVTMFSFGPIKRATAGGGAVLRIRNPELRTAVRERLCTYAVQSRGDYARRLMVLALLRVASHHRLYGLLYRLLGLAGDPDQLVSNMGKTRKSQQSQDRLRRQPCVALKRVLARRVQQHVELPSMVPVETRLALGKAVPGSAAASPPSWVLPVTVTDPDRVVYHLRRLGYDPSTLSSLIRVTHDKELHAMADDAAGQHWLKKTIFLPTDDTMPPEAREKMIHALLSDAALPDG